MQKVLVALNLGFVIAFAPVAAASAEQSARSVVVIDAFKFSAKATQAHPRMRAGIEATLARDGWTVVQGRGTDGADCGATHECLATAARESDAGYVVRVSGQRAGGSEYGYDVIVDAYSRVTDKVRSGSWSCGLCDSKGVGELAGKSAAELLAKATQDEALVRRAGKGSAPSRAAAPPREPSRPALVAAAEAPAQPSRVAWAPWTMIGAGVVGMAYGGWALSKNGDSTGTGYVGSPSSYGHDTYSSRTVGGIALIGGGVLALAGATWLIVSRSRAAVSASPNHVSFRVRF